MTAPIQTTFVTAPIFGPDRKPTIQSSLLLILGGLRIGDTLMCLPETKAYFRMNPISSFSWVCGNWMSEIPYLVERTEGFPPLRTISVGREMRMPPQDWDDISNFDYRMLEEEFPKHDKILRLKRELWSESGQTHQIFWWANSMGITPKELIGTDIFSKIKKYQGE